VVRKAVLRKKVKKTDRSPKGPANKTYEGFLANGTVATHLWCPFRVKRISTSCGFSCSFLRLGIPVTQPHQPHRHNDTKANSPPAKAFLGRSQNVKRGCRGCHKVVKSNARYQCAVSPRSHLLPPTNTCAASYEYLCYLLRVPATDPGLLDFAACPKKHLRYCVMGSSLLYHSRIPFRLPFFAST
jgi:hypothetical protein